MSDDRPPSARLEQWVSIGATIVAPATLLGALLFYFGYVSSRSEYAYFGVDVNTIGLSTQEYIMRSPQPLLVPLLVLLLTGAGVLLLNTAVRGRVTAVTAGGPGASAGGDGTVDARGHPAMTAERIGRIASWSRSAGQAVLTAGVVLLFIYPYVRDWSFYALATPLLIALGAAVTAYASRVLVLLRHSPQPRVVRDAGPPRATRGPSNRPVMARWAAMALVYVVIAACIFWATATIAQWSGRGLAEYDALHLGELPSVILDSKERLFLHDPGIEETSLPASAGQTFHYRYRGLRLLIQGQDRMFLVPDAWSASDSTLIVPLDGSVRVQFQFQNQPP